MHGIIINIDPIMFRVGGFEIAWHSLLSLLGVVIAIPIFTYRLKKRGFKPEDFLAFYPWALIAALIGARLFHVVEHPEIYLHNPAAIFQVWEGGLAIWGGLIGGAVATIIYARVKHLSLGRLADALVPALLVGQILGRAGCLINGDAYGSPTSLPWAFIYTNPNAVMPANLIGVPTQPYPAYEILWNLVGLLLVWRLERYLHKDGLLFIGYLAYYSVARFVLTFVRQEKIWFWGLQEAQVLALVLIAVSVVLLVHRLKHPMVESPDTKLDQKEA